MSVEKTKQATTSASAVLHGNTKTIEARTDNGKALSTILRLSMETSSNLNENTYSKIESMFNDFCDKVESLF